MDESKGKSVWSDGRSGTQSIVAAALLSQDHSSPPICHCVGAEEQVLNISNSSP